MNQLQIFFVLIATVVATESERDCYPNYLENKNVPEAFNKTLPAIIPSLDCTNESIDAAAQTADQRIYFFKGDYYWRLQGSNVVYGYPRLIMTDWDGLPSNLDAAFTWPNGRTFFFKGDLYWGFYNRKMDPGYPKYIRDGFCGVPNNIDAALYYSNGITYFFKGSLYWGFYGGEVSPPVHEAKPMSDWRGMPSTVEAAIEWNSQTVYFFKGGYYYAYPNPGPYPLHGYWGLSCENLMKRIPINLQLEERK